MALLFMDGFDVGDYLSRYVIIGSSFISSGTATRFNTGRTLQVDHWFGEVHRAVPASSKIFLGVAFRCSEANASAYVLAFYSDNGNVMHMNLRMTSTTTLGLYRGTTLLSTTPITLAQWYYVEFSSTIHDTTGTAVVRLNGVEVINFTGDTRNGGTSTNIDKFSFRTQGYYDDIYVCDDTGTTNNTFLGDVRVQTLVPNAAGANTDFTPTGGTNYANVADIPDDTGTYNTSSTVGHKDTYDFSDLVSGTGTVFGIQTNMHAKKADAGIGALKEIVVAGATTYDGNTTQLPTSTAWIGQIRETNPDTSAAWTVGDVNSLEAGAEVA